MKRLVALLFAPVFLVGCATMNRSECRNADWRMIGMEDGMKGRSPAYIGNHRQACAKHNVTPDLDEYRKGLEEGIRQFCSPSKGFELGKRGSQYNGVCPADLEPLFLESYHQGSKLRAIANEIDTISSRLDSDRKQLKKLKDALDEKEDQLIREGNSEDRRALLLREIKELQNKIDRLRETIRRQEEYRDIKTEEYEQFER